MAGDAKSASPQAAVPLRICSACDKPIDPTATSPATCRSYRSNTVTNHWHPACARCVVPDCKFVLPPSVFDVYRASNGALPKDAYERQSSLASLLAEYPLFIGRDLYCAKHYRLKLAPASHEHVHELKSLIWEGDVGAATGRATGLGFVRNAKSTLLGVWECDAATGVPVYGFTVSHTPEWSKLNFSLGPLPVMPLAVADRSNSGAVVASASTQDVHWTVQLNIAFQFIPEQNTRTHVIPSWWKRTFTYAEGYTAIGGSILSPNPSLSFIGQCRARSWVDGTVRTAGPVVATATGSWAPLSASAVSMSAASSHRPWWWCGELSAGTATNYPVSFGGRASGLFQSGELTSGKLVWPDGGVCDGTFRAELQLTGTRTFANGSVLKFPNSSTDAPVATANFRLRNGATFVGTFELNPSVQSCVRPPATIDEWFATTPGKRHGVRSSADGSSREEGEWNGDRHISGTRRWGDGTTYDGTFADTPASAHIAGTRSMSDGTVVTIDARTGSGREVRKDGSYYEGFYFGGVKHGTGRFYWPDGSYVAQDWKNGVRVETGDIASAKKGTEILKKLGAVHSDVKDGAAKNASALELLIDVSATPATAATVVLPSNPLAAAVLPTDGAAVANELLRELLREMRLTRELQAKQHAELIASLAALSASHNAMTPK